jgi:hypothetical protein
MLPDDVTGLPLEVIPVPSVIETDVTVPVATESLSTHAAESESQTQKVSVDATIAYQPSCPVGYAELKSEGVSKKPLSLADDAICQDADPFASDVKTYPSAAPVDRSKPPTERSPTISGSGKD